MAEDGSGKDGRARRRVGGLGGCGRTVDGGGKVPAEPGPLVGGNGAVSKQCACGSDENPEDAVARVYGGRGAHISGRQGKLGSGGR